MVSAAKEFIHLFINSFIHQHLWSMNDVHCMLGTGICKHSVNYHMVL